MADKQILIGRKANGDPIILDGNPVTLEDGDTLSLAPLSTSGWKWTLEFLDLANINQSTLPADEVPLLIGGTPFTETEYSSEDPETGEPDPVPLSADQEFAEQLNEAPNVLLIEDSSGDFEEGVFVYEISANSTNNISGRVRRRRQL